MTKEMLWLLMGHLVCIGQWAAFIMVEYAFLGRGRRFRFPCLWAALLAAVFLVASIRHDIGFFNVESTPLPGVSTFPSGRSGATAAACSCWLLLLWGLACLQPTLSGAGGGSRR